MSLLVETIRIEDGIPVNISFHNERMMRTMRDLFSIAIPVDLLDILTVPDNAKMGIFKCRVEYDREVRKIEFVRYYIKPVNSLKLTEDNHISYPFKFSDRRMLDELLKRRGDCDDILIVRNGMITDTSYANVVLKNQTGKWFTPTTFLLPGTRRARLLQQGIIGETKISLNDLKKYSEIRLINAMIGIDDTEGIPCSKVII